MLQIELVTVELRHTDFVPCIGLQAEMLDKLSEGGTWYRAARCTACSLRLAITVCRVWVGDMQMVFVAFGFTMGGGVGELLEVEHVAELVEAADGGTALTVLPFGQAGVGQCF